MFDAKTIRQLAEKQQAYVIDCRRTIHRFAELGGQETKTRAFVEKEAKSLKLTVERVANTSLVVTLDTGKPGNGVALRADMDALPVKENPCNTKLRRAVVSDNPNTCHACGHDAHTAVLLGAMRVLCEMKQQLCGKIYFCFEEGEEVAYGFDGILEALQQRQVNTVFGLHVSSALEHGLVSMDDGPRMGGMVGINASFVGRGGHGSRPDLSINPVFAAAEAINNLAVAFANQIDANETVTLGITSIQGGEVYNVIPNTATVLGTMRFFSLTEGKKALRILKKVFNHTAEMNLCSIDYHPMTNIVATPTVNDPQAAAFARETVGQLLPEQLVNTERWFGSETFAHYLARYKGVFAFLGVRNEELGCTAEHHNEYFDIDESALVNGVICHAAYAAAAVFSEQVAQWGFTPEPDISFDEDEEPQTSETAEQQAEQQNDAPAGASTAKYDLDTKIGVLLKSEQAKKAVSQVVDGIVNHPQISFAKGFTVRKAAKFLPEKLTPEVLEKIEKALATVTD